MSIETLKQALEALKDIQDFKPSDKTAAAITTLRTAIEQAEFDAAHEALEKQAGIHVSQQPAPVQEPVAQAQQLSKELLGVIADVEEGDGFDDVCLDTIKYVYEQLATPPAAPVQEPKQSEIFSGVDFSNGILTVCVFCRRPDGVAELLHLEQTELQPPAAPVQDIEHCVWARNGNAPCPHTAAQRQWVGLDAADWFKWWRTATVLGHTQAEIDFADFLLIATAVQDVLEKKNGAGQRLWIGLTQEQRNEIVFNAADEESATYQTEDKLRELNGGQA